MTWKSSGWRARVKRWKDAKAFRFRAIQFPSYSCQNRLTVRPKELKMYVYTRWDYISLLLSFTVKGKWNLYVADSYILLSRNWRQIDEGRGLFFFRWFTAVVGINGDKVHISYCITLYIFGYFSLLLLLFYHHRWFNQATAFRFLSSTSSFPLRFFFLAYGDVLNVMHCRQLHAWCILQSIFLPSSSSDRDILFTILAKLHRVQQPVWVGCAMRIVHAAPNGGKR